MLRPGALRVLALAWLRDLAKRILLERVETRRGSYVVLLRTRAAPAYGCPCSYDAQRSIVAAMRCRGDLIGYRVSARFCTCDSAPEFQEEKHRKPFHVL